MGNALLKKKPSNDAVCFNNKKNDRNASSRLAIMRNLAKCIVLRRNRKVQPCFSYLYGESGDLSSPISEISSGISQVEYRINTAEFQLSKELEEIGFDESQQRVIHTVGLSKEYFLTTNQLSGCSSWDDETVFENYEPVRRRKIDRERREEWEKMVYGLT